MTDEDKKTVGEVIGGLMVHPLPEGWSPLEGIILVKCLDESGHPTWAFRTTEGLNEEELLGALTVRIELLRSELLESYSGNE